MLVAVFNLMWLGVVIYADVTSTLWSRLTQAAVALLLLGWAARRTAQMIGKA
ncbi:hypothetical protein OUY22_25905 [Nonomuraea sp. MCN248]|uniref:Uncharacterized protein n=1 Tax=Nonomuraea corallina TaxID=2989783 RepID=A0ABT4SIL6_9ACTN|nr:hypothetical protein [Nonomuraea corallina]MDA0636858.1 hypothetical protein [Nonomuraea corallina]